MPVLVALPQFKGWAVSPDDITFGEAQQEQVPVLIDGRVRQVNIVRRSLTFRLKGIPAGAAIGFIDQARTASVSQILGTPVYEDINMGGYVLQQAVLVKATPSAPIVFNGGAIMPNLELVYESQVFE